MIEPYLTAAEIRCAERNLIRLTQRTIYKKEITILQITDLPESNKLSVLTPFLDNEGVLRIEGRLRYASANYENCCPPIIPTNSELAVRLVVHAHETLLHARSKYTMEHVLRSFV